MTTTKGASYKRAKAGHSGSPELGGEGRLSGKSAPKAGNFELHFQG